MPPNAFGGKTCHSFIPPKQYSRYCLEEMKQCQHFRKRIQLKILAFVPLLEKKVVGPLITPRVSGYFEVFPCFGLCTLYQTIITLANWRLFSFFEPITLYWTP